MRWVACGYDGCNLPVRLRVVDSLAAVHIPPLIGRRGPQADHCGRMSVPADLPPLILRPRALADGYDDKEIARHRRSGVWSSVRRGAYVGSASAEALTRRSRHRLLIEATLSKLRRPAVVSHASAAVLHGLPLWSVPLTAVHVTRNPPAKSDSDRNLICHVCRLGPDEVTVVDGMAVTTPTRTILDLGRLIAFTPAVIAADDGLRRILTTREFLMTSLQDLIGTRGSRNAARVVQFADGRSESVGESRSRVVLAEAGLPAPDLQVEVFAEGGFFLGRGDFGYRQQRCSGSSTGESSTDGCYALASPRATPCSTRSAARTPSGMPGGRSRAGRGQISTFEASWQLACNVPWEETDRRSPGRIAPKLSALHLTHQVRCSRDGCNAAAHVTPG